MCGRYSLAAPDPDALRRRFGIATESMDTSPRYNIAPSTEVLAVTTTKTGSRRGETLRWGLVPPFMKDAKGGAKMINARAEGVADKPAFRGSFTRFRCLIPADGFYEWARPPGGPKQPFHITVRDEELFAFAGLWAVWHRGEDDEIRSATIVTTAANAQMSAIHDRMPVILRPGDEDSWLDSATPTPALDELMRGLPDGAYDLRPVSSAVNNVRNDGPELVASDDSAPTPLF